MQAAHGLSTTGGGGERGREGGGGGEDWWEGGEGKPGENWWWWGGEREVDGELEKTVNGVGGGVVALPLYSIFSERERERERELSVRKQRRGGSFALHIPEKWRGIYIEGVKARELTTMVSAYGNGYSKMTSSLWNPFLHHRFYLIYFANIEKKEDY